MAQTTGGDTFDAIAVVAHRWIAARTASGRGRGGRAGGGGPGAGGRAGSGGPGGAGWAGSEQLCSASEQFPGVGAI